MLKQPRLKVRKQTTKSKTNVYTYYMVDAGTVDGKRQWIRQDEQGHRFTTEEAAKEFVKRETARRKIRGKKSGQDAAKLSPAALRDAVEARALIKDYGSLTEAAKFFIDHNDPDIPERTVSAVVDEYIDDRIGAKRRPSTIKDIKSRLGPFSTDYGDTPIRIFEKSDGWKQLRSWVQKKGPSLTSQKNIRVHLSGLFEFARQEGYVLNNPVSRFKIKTADKEKVEILTVKQTEKLLKKAQVLYPEMVPYFAICLFAGLRPGGECRRLRWEDIDFELEQIYVSPTVAKKAGQDRYIDMRPNLIEWLTPYIHRSGGIYYSEHWYRAIRKESKIRWAHDVMRHSFGSYLYALTNDSGAVAEQMGHRGKMMLFKHYRSAISKKCKETDPEAYWSIRPDSGSVVAFPKTA